MITDDQIDAAFDGTDFGPEVEGDKRKHVALWVLKKALGWHCGPVATNILLDLGLLKNAGLSALKVSEAGRKFCYDFFSDETAEIKDMREALHATTEALHSVIDSGARLDQRIADRIVEALAKAGSEA